MSNQRDLEDRRQTDGKFGAGRSRTDSATAEDRADALDADLIEARHYLQQTRSPDSTAGRSNALDGPPAESRFRRGPDPTQPIDRINKTLRDNADEYNDTDSLILEQWEQDTEGQAVVGDLAARLKFGQSNDQTGEGGMWGDAAREAGFEVVEHSRGDERIGDVIIVGDSLAVITGESEDRSWHKPSVHGVCVNTDGSAYTHIPHRSIPTYRLQKD